MPVSASDKQLPGYLPVFFVALENGMLAML